MRSKVALVLVPLFASALALAAQEVAEISYKADVEPIFLAECNDCHGAKRPKKGLDLSAGVGYDTLVGKPANEVPDLLLVKPGDPDGSYLWHKLEHTATEGKGMPRTMFSSKKLSDDQLALIERWIAGGAKP